jgi:hypothetical protein
MEMEAFMSAIVFTIRSASGLTQMQNQSAIDIDNKKKLEHIECLARERSPLSRENF